MLILLKQAVAFSFFVIFVFSVLIEKKIGQFFEQYFPPGPQISTNLGLRYFTALPTLLLRPVARGAALPLETRQAALKVAAGTAELPGC